MNPVELSQNSLPDGRRISPQPNDEVGLSTSSNERAGVLLRPIDVDVLQGTSRRVVTEPHLHAHRQALGCFGCTPRNPASSRAQHTQRLEEVLGHWVPEHHAEALLVPRLLVPLRTLCSALLLLLALLLRRVRGVEGLLDGSPIDLAPLSTLLRRRHPSPRCVGPSCRCSLTLPTP